MDKHHPPLPLFAKARKTDPETSHKEMDRLNENNCKALCDRLYMVLAALKANDGLTAMELGKIMAQANIERLPWAWKSMSKLEEMGYVRREEGEKAFKCFITDKGKRYLREV